MTATTPPLSILRRKQLENLCGLSRSTIYSRINPKDKRFDPSFPKPISLGAGAVGWISHEVDAWLTSRVKASRQEATA